MQAEKVLLPAPGGTGKGGRGNLRGLPLWEAFPLYRLLPFEDRPGDEAESIGQEGRRNYAGRGKREAHSIMHQWREDFRADTEGHNGEGAG